MVQNRKKLCNFTLYELAVVMCMLTLMAVLLPMTLATSTQDAELVACTGNLMALGSAVEMYRYDNDERFMMPAYAPPKSGVCEISWDTLLACPKLGNYVKPSKLNCPSMPVFLPERWEDEQQYSNPYNWMWAYPGYGYNALWAGGTRRGESGYFNAEPYTIASIEDPAELLLLADSAAPKREYGGRFLWPNYTVNETVLWPRHGGAVNVLYADGHVKLTHSGSQECNEDSVQLLYAKGAELECSATCNRATCKWRCDLE